MRRKLGREEKYRRECNDKALDIVMLQHENESLRLAIAARDRAARKVFRAFEASFSLWKRCAYNFDETGVRKAISGMRRTMRKEGA